MDKTKNQRVSDKINLQFFYDASASKYVMFTATLYATITEKLLSGLKISPMPSWQHKWSSLLGGLKVKSSNPARCQYRCCCNGWWNTVSKDFFLTSKSFKCKVIWKWWKSKMSQELHFKQDSNCLLLLLYKYTSKFVTGMHETWGTSTNYLQYHLCFYSGQEQVSSTKWKPEWKHMSAILQTAHW